MPQLLPETKGQQLLEWLRGLGAPAAQPRLGGRRVSPGDVREVKRRRGAAIAEAKFVEQLRAKARAEQQAERKFAFEQMKHAQEQQRKDREFIINKRIDYMKGLEPGSASYGLAQARNKDWFGTLSPGDQEAFVPYMEQLFSPTQEKLMEFERIYGEPVDPSIVDPNEDPVTRAKLQFANEDYSGRKAEFLGGVKYEPKKTSYINENQWAWRDDEGKMGILSRAAVTGQEWVKNALETAGIPLDTAIIDGGMVPVGTPEVITDGFESVEVTPMRSIINGKRGHRKVSVGRKVSAGQRKLPPFLSDFSLAITMGGVTNWQEFGPGKAPVGAMAAEAFLDQLDAYEGVSKLSKAEQMRLYKNTMQEMIGTQLGGLWNVEIHKAGEFKGFRGPFPIDHFARLKGASVFFIPGVLTPFANKGGQLVGSLYWDEEFDVVRDALNQVKGTMSQVTAEAWEEPTGNWLPQNAEMRIPSPRTPRAPMEVR